MSKIPTEITQGHLIRPQCLTPLSCSVCSLAPWINTCKSAIPRDQAEEAAEVHTHDKPHWTTFKQKTWIAKSMFDKKMMKMETKLNLLFEATHQTKMAMAMRNICTKCTLLPKFLQFILDLASLPLVDVFPIEVVHAIIEWANLFQPNGEGHAL